MLPRRAGSGADGTLEQANEMETTRAATDAGGEKAEKKKDDEHMSLFWRLFGGTILSIAALVTINIFNNMSSSIAELRADVNREREARGELVKKEEFNSRVTAQYERIRGIDVVKVDLEGVKEKSRTNAATIDTVKRDTGVAVDAVKKDAAATAESQKKDTTALEGLKEKVAGLEAIKKDVAGLDSLKEKTIAAAAELKILRADVQKVSGEIEKNKVSDLERKTNRDTQYKQVQEMLKELQKGLQDCREKLARLEGAKPPTPATGETPQFFTRPPAPSTTPKAPEGK